MRRAYGRWSVGVVSLALAMMLGCAGVAQGQRPTAVAPAAGDFEGIERARYDAVRRAPRSADARLALGEWLAARGQLRSGAVLLEEARLFGADPRVVAARVAPVYRWLRDWASLEALPSSPLSSAERAVVSALAERGTEVAGADSVVLPFAPLEIGALGRVPLLLGQDTVWAEVDPEETGIVLPGLGRGAGLVQVLGDDRRGLSALISECALGAITLRGVPARVDTTLGAGRAKLGFDVFASLAPTVDARAGTVVLRRSGRAVSTDQGYPLRLDFPGVRLATRADELPVLMTSAAGRAALRGRPWSIDLRGGMIWVGVPR